MRKLLNFILPGLIILLLSLLTAIYIFLTSSLPDYKGKIISAEMNASVTVYFDKMGIPQICAAADDDLWFVLGWIHAQERLFQMELTRRIASGRLAELLGKDVLPVDRLNRTIGHRHHALSALPYLDADIHRRLSAYTSGINAWVEYTTALPFEFYLLGLDFEDWTALDCLIVYSFQTWYSDFLQNNDALYISFQKQFGRAKAIELQAHYPEWAPTTAFYNPYKNYRIDNSILPVFSGITTASNGWVIAPHRSVSDYAMLACDPHLEIFRLPQFWYSVGLHCTETHINVFGATTPGLPYVAYGHNGKAAWAFTAGGIDITDYYIEQLHPEDKSLYKIPQGWAQFQEIEEIIHISGTDTTERLIIKKTRHGPVLEEDDSLDYVYALRWAGFDMSLSESMQNGFKLMNVSDFDSFRNVITHFGALNANWIYADKSGTIGYQLGTPIPVRKFENSQFLLPGWESRYDWKGYYDLENAPYSINPERGWLANCNNKPAAENLGYDLPGNFAADRILRISNLLDSKTKFNARDMQKFQYDYVSDYMLRWKDSAAHVLEQLNMPQIAEEVREWNGDLSGSGHLNALMMHWLYYLKKLTFGDEFQSKNIKLENLFAFRDIILEKVFLKGPDYWFDDVRTRKKIESKEFIAATAMQMAITEVNNQNWSDLQILDIAHPFAQNVLLDFVLNLSRGPFKRSGTKSTLNATVSRKDPDKGFKALVGPSMRLVVDFADVNTTSIVFPAGQSGHPLSSHFFDFYKLWSAENIWIVPFDLELIAQNAVSQLFFDPELK
jgi:penicillin amidase